MERYKSLIESQSDIKVGDTVLTGKFLNKPMVVTGFGISDKGQPTLLFGKKEIPLYKVRIQKLMPAKKEAEALFTDQFK